MSTVIKVEDLSKAYQLGDFGTGTISRDLERFWARLNGKEDPFLKIGEANDRSVKSSSDIAWSLRDISFEIEQGDAVGIIGRNGAGKSTLLKVLSRVTSPTTGSVKLKGRIASLLEVGTGFHPELTGRENIYLNGAILGMRKAEIRKKFDAIVDFAGVARYIDTPVKRYSSGMYVRLAFAVAAHLESEILIVDEVLAVGDAEFQKKCLGKMGEVSKGEGRTVLFVSHNMSAVDQLCTKGIVLNNGTLIYDGDKNGAIELYRNIGRNASGETSITELITGRHAHLKIEDIRINGQPEPLITLEGQELNITIVGEADADIQCNIEISIEDSSGTRVFFYSPGHLEGKIMTISKGTFNFREQIIFPDGIANGTFLMNMALCYPNLESYLYIQGIRLVINTAKTATGRPLNYADIGFFMLKGSNGS